MVYVKSVVLALMLAQSKASLTRIAGYEPDTIVTDHAALDQDQALMESFLQALPADYLSARNVYENGAYSKNFARLRLDQALPTTVSKGTAVVGTDTQGRPVNGKALSDATGIFLDFQYPTSEDQSNYVGCRVDPNTNPVTTGCLESTGSVTIAGLEAQGSFGYTYSATTDNLNGRTIQGFSTELFSILQRCGEKCYYADFLTYYGNDNYADVWVLAALSGGQTNFDSGRGNANFAPIGDSGRIEAAKKGAAYLNVWMYVIREMVDAVDDCVASCNTCNDDPVHAWDEAVAFYAGSLEGTDGSGDGVFPYALADKRCENFKTCGENGDSLTGTSSVNVRIIRAFQRGQAALKEGNCDGVRTEKDLIEKLMVVPLVQGTIRYAYLTDTAEPSEKGIAEGATFAAAVLPVVHACSPTDAQTIYDNMVISPASPSAAADFPAVKRAFENNYQCMGITCQDVGGLFFEGESTYFTGAEPCGGSGSGARNMGVGLSIGLALGGLVMHAAA